MSAKNLQSLVADLEARLRLVDPAGFEELKRRCEKLQKTGRDEDDLRNYYGELEWAYRQRMEGEE